MRKTFKYLALDSDGREINGIIKAKSKKEVTLNLFKRQYIPLKINRYIKVDYRIKNKELHLLFKKMYLIVKSGVDINSGLEILIEESNNLIIKSALKSISYEINKGESLSKAIKITNIFPKIVDQMIKVGEETGRLEEVLEKLSDYFEKNEEIENRIKSISIYPKIIVAISLLVLIFMLIIIVPKIAELLEYNNFDLPLVTKIIIYISKIMRKPGTIIMIILVTLFLRFYLNKSNYNEKFKYKLSPFKNLYKKIELSKILLYIDLMYSSGISILDSLEYILSVIDENYIKNKIENLLVNIKSGGSLSDSIEKISPDLLLLRSSIKIGEETGRLDHVLKDLIKYYRDELFNNLEYILRFLEPILILIIALTVGLILISFILPIMNLMNNII